METLTTGLTASGTRLTRCSTGTEASAPPPQATMEILTPAKEEDIPIVTAMARLSTRVSKTSTILWITPWRCLTVTTSPGSSRALPATSDPDRTQQRTPPREILIITRVLGMQYKHLANTSHSITNNIRNINNSHRLSRVRVRNYLHKFLRSQDQDQPVKRDLERPPMMRMITWKLNWKTYWEEITRIHSTRLMDQVSGVSG